MKKHEEVLALDAADVVRVYSGKPGCGCGCRGKYYEDERNIRRVVSWMKREARSAVDIRRAGMENDVAWVETERRYLWAYLREGTQEEELEARMCGMCGTVDCENLWCAALLEDYGRHLEEMEAGRK